jgi:hypothetical protein
LPASARSSGRRPSRLRTSSTSRHGLPRTRPSTRSDGAVSGSSASRSSSARWT